MDEIKNIPLYPHTGAYAQEHGEIKQYWDSMNANVSCAEAIRKAASEHYDYASYCFDTEAAAKQVFEQCGVDRTLYVLANTVREKAWDGRISRDNIEWAKTYPVVEDTDPFGGRMNTRFLVDAVHPGLVNMLAKEARKLAAQERKPSIRAQLAAAKSEQKENPAGKTKNREEAR